MVDTLPSTSSMSLMLGPSVRMSTFISTVNRETKGARDSSFGHTAVVGVAYSVGVNDTPMMGNK